MIKLPKSRMNKRPLNFSPVIYWLSQLNTAYKTAENKKPSHKAEKQTDKLLSTKAIDQSP